MKDEQDSPYLHESHSKTLELIFTLATGALALSITFRSGIIGTNKSYLWLLSVAWVLLSITSISYVFIRLMESSIDTIWTAQRMKYNFTKRLLGDIRKDTEELVKVLGDSISEEEKNTKMLQMHEFSIATRKKLDAEVSKASESVATMSKPIIGRTKSMLFSFLLGVLALLAFGVISNIKEANQSLAPMRMDACSAN